jgi:signal transduction histidine kinase
VRFAEEQSSGMLCSFLLFDEKERVLRHGAAPSLPDAYNRAVDGLAIGPAAGSCGTAAFRREPVVVTDIATDPLWAAYHTTAAEYGLAACWSTPVFGAGGGLLGTFAMYFREPRAPAPEHLKLIEIITQTAAVAIDHARAEEKIRSLNAGLERRVAERTKEMEDANRELESFSYSVSHDLRAPLRHVLGYVDLLKRAADGHLPEKAARYLSTIGDAAEEMSELIDDLLAFSRMGRAEMKSDTVILDNLVEQAIRILEMETRGRRIEWKIAPLPNVTGDTAMLRIVLANLISNAVKYTSTRDPACIEIGCSGTQNGRAEIFVRDNGVGFDMQYAHKLFGVFQRLHRQEEFEGTGIGLATVRRIIARHGGTVRAEGELDRGATFSFSIGLASPVPATEWE